MISSLPVQYGYRGQSGNLDASRELVYGIRNFWRSTHPVLTGQQLARTAPGTAWTGSELGYDQQRTVADISRLKPGRTTSTSADHDQSFISVRTQPHHFGRTKANCLLIFPSFHSTIISLRSLLVFTTWVIFVDFPYPYLGVLLDRRVHGSLVDSVPRFRIPARSVHQGESTFLRRAGVTVFCREDMLTEFFPFGPITLTPYTCTSTSMTTNHILPTTRLDFSL
jgi:hypothetical protein